MPSYLGYILSAVLLVVVIYLLLKNKKEDTNLLINNSTELLNYQTQINTLTKTNEELSAKVFAHDNIVKIFDESIQTLKQDIDLKSSELKKSIEEGSLVKQSLKNAELVIQELQEKINNYETKLNDKSELESLNHKIHTLESHLSEAEMELARKESSLTQITSSNERITAENQTLLKRISDFEMQNKILIDKITAAELEIAESKKESIVFSNASGNPSGESVKNILLVDDSIVIRTKLGNLLNNNNYNVTLAKDGEEAISILDSNYFDLVITDLEMPNINGYDLILKAKNIDKSKSTPFIAITGHEEVNINVDNSSNLIGINKKPWNDDLLLAKIESVFKK